MLLSELHSMVSTEINRKTAFDTLIPGKVRQAVRWLERNRTLKYMERFVSFTIDPDVAQPRALEFPGEPKKINFFRIANDDGTYWYLRQIDPVEQIDTEETYSDAELVGYWLDGTDYIWLDATPTQSYNGELSYERYTTWEPDNDDFEHWLLDNADDFLLAQTMIQMLPTMRAPELFGMYKAQRDEALKTLIDADEELRQGNRSERVRYEGH